MKSLAALAALFVTVAAATPAFARSSYVIDDAHLLSQNAIADINQQVGVFNAQTGKEVVVVTTPALDGANPADAAERSFAQQQVNGVEIFIAKNEKQIRIAGDTASRQFFPSYQPIYEAMKPYFSQGDFDQGVETGVSLILNTYRGHESSLHRGRAPVAYSQPATSVVRSSTGGGHVSIIVWIVILAVIFFVIRGIFRAMAGPRMYGPGPGGPGYGPGGPGYGGPGYGGPGYGGYGGGGGGFWSGMLGGLGGAFLGNELFGNRGNTIIEEPGNYAGVDGGGYGGGDASGWQNDPGQVDSSNIGGGGWGGDAGGGGGWGGGGDFGGGGGGDSGGGGW
jgi:uncharacterized membrane protein YgcG